MTGDAMRTLLRLSAAVAAGSRERRIETMRIASESASATTIEEALLQSYLFLGYPAALNGFVQSDLPVPISSATIRCLPYIGIACLGNW